MARYEIAYAITNGKEKGYVPLVVATKIGDKGGETYNGIARNFNPSWGGWAIIDQYKKQYGVPKLGFIIPNKFLNELVHSYLKKKYWDVLLLDKVTNQSLANFIYDFGVNSGVPTVILSIQKHFGLLADGIVGEKTLQKINNPLTQKRLFDFLQDYRKLVIAKTDYSTKIKESLQERNESFFFQETAV
jgi:lysozyme family protein